MNLRITNGIPAVCLILIIGLVLPAAATDACVLSISSIPADSHIKIDGRYKGISPFSTSLSCGNHTIEIEKNGYTPFLEQVTLADGDDRAILANLEYQSRRGSVLIRSEPSGGTLYFDGIFRGITPVQVDNLVYGRHTVLIKKPGYQDYRDIANAGPETVLEYTEYLVPDPQTGFLGVSSYPEGALVYLDCLEMGNTNTRLERVAVGNHTVLLQMEGYLDYTVPAEVIGDESVLVHADLVKSPDSGTLIIDSSPHGADILLNGTFKALTPAVLDNVPFGAYLLQVRKRNFSEFSAPVVLNAGETRELSVFLANGTMGSQISREVVYLAHPNASQLLPGMIDTTLTIDQTYTWYSNGHEATVRLRIPDDLYEYYKGQSHQPQSVDEYKRYTITEEDRVYLHDLIGMLKDAGENKHLAARNDYRNAVSFVQSIRYEKDLDPVTKQETEYWKYPLETLADGSGDCEDTAILTAAILKEMGYDVALVLLPEHAAVAVACDNCNGYYYPLDGKRYYFLETTGAGYSLGTMDEKKYQTSSARIIPI
jgi:hypothetical protein